MTASPTIGQEIDTGTPELLCSLRDRVAIITFNRPDARNALSDQLTPALRRMIRRMGDDPAVGALLLTGTGTAFCAGGDVKGMGDRASGAELSQADKVARLRERQRTLTGALVGVRKPTIAALPGAAAGAGLAIALACDLRIAAESAFLATGYARIALTGDYGISWLLTRLAGPARARELMFFGERIDARRGEALGLINRVVPDAELQAAALAWAARLAAGPTEAFAGIKDNLDHALTADFLSSLDHEADNMVAAAGTMAHREAVRAFVEKRPPDFSCTS
ncbi:enoyl-CoA hydratase/isomerase family protein [Bradyrhizobium sp. U87765 SZCCT0131]|uniref:enoyl-CoA hydratase-related protein n=1 Tax=unclassified Bradyrhizobium TaxID=2631580 RepID=UPI001BA750A6|nr:MULTISPECIES: enoyl-CoA hydratase-related protein [unclassified Bradyrhizobium]MBR1221928.1 enoyl-CoA hydratase/isomerase family protein [Bradyrhizobium sp. U87765 SZCCT0131]MBR1263874.1 enoyl-CoA hydratase/isomerase family protein [Bradyrhizobium sp. U87765 SZCCT0134]MBR1302556.1 enoyl-CoA hydratase/isomerase family protein [Bradyrhizobium sp. U87765 SZCCT0110]MBR1320124.1 enoyl-CoA hydratase/isomerase family protein [Bradyrhizobium sp. U87765 SZCCT0109]MBR1348763.1 enoyl-CoA hydratase/iso